MKRRQQRAAAKPSRNGHSAKVETASEMDAVFDDTDSLTEQGAHTCAQNNLKGLTVDEAAAITDVSPRMVQMAGRVVECCIPEIVHLVEAGRITVRDAYSVRSYPHWIQRIAFNRFIAGKCKRLAEA